MNEHVASLSRRGWRNKHMSIRYNVIIEARDSVIRKYDRVISEKEINRACRIEPEQSLEQAKKSEKAYILMKSVRYALQDAYALEADRVTLEINGKKLSFNLLPLACRTACEIHKRVEETLQNQNEMPEIA